MVRLKRLGLDTLSAYANNYLAKKQAEAQVLSPGDEAIESMWKTFRKAKSGQAVCYLVIAESSGKCAYCEKGEAGAIDHHASKSTNPHRLFEYHNMMPSCALCNQFKQTGTVLDPYTQDPDGQFLYVALTGTVMPAPTAAPDGLAESTIRSCRLDREVLQDFRRVTAMQLRCMARKAAEEGPDPEVVAILVYLLSASGPHIGMARFLLRADPRFADWVGQVRQSEPEVDTVLSAFPYVG